MLFLEIGSGLVGFFLNCEALLTRAGPSGTGQLTFYLGFSIYILIFFKI